MHSHVPWVLSAIKAALQTRLNVRHARLDSTAEVLVSRRSRVNAVQDTTVPLVRSHRHHRAAMSDLGPALLVPTVLRKALLLLPVQLELSATL
jgi:hypothetical protein